jgi:hypothetical protein
VDRGEETQRRDDGEPTAGTWSSPATTSIIMRASLPAIPTWTSLPTACAFVRA